MTPRTKSRARKSTQAIRSGFANVDGTRLHYLVAGQGDPVVLLHGYAETSHMWLPLIPKLADRHTVIAVDLRGAGQSATPPDGYTKAGMARDIHALTQKLGYKRIRIVGHDIGLMVAYAFAAQYPSEVERIVLMDAFLPGVGQWRDVWLMRDLWHFHFYGKTPLALVHGRERIYFEHFWNDFAANPKRSVPERDRRFYAKAYARPGGMRSGFEYFRAFEKDAEEFRPACTETIADADAGPDRGKSFGRVPDSTGKTRGEQRGRCSHSRLWPLAHGRSAGTSDPEAGGISQPLEANQQAVL